ncbi:uncharacterized protein LOC132170816 [Corylus avellana]|uniref:uncharacterized protein LOC132170816 n=1 Tax=Corylus avellana TaxID=13451 RepID=UPI00286A0283|nr:uncharacterized protein LOC132170816 [Corylus avellana]
MHNEKQRVSTYCKKKCGWRVYASWKSSTKYFQINTLFNVHNCGSHYYNKRASIKWAAHQYINSFRDQANWKASTLKVAIRRDYNVEMTLLACHHAKGMALKLLTGSRDEQYKLTRVYCSAIRKWNLGNSAYIQRDMAFFQRMYVFVAACQHSGQLYVAIARGGNDDIFPIAYAICETESRDIWTWFLNTLLEDTENSREHTWLFMSNRQKGLMEAIEYLMHDV